MKSLVDERKKVLDGTAKSLRWSKWLWRLEFLSLLELCKRQKGNHPLLEPSLPPFFFFFFPSPYSFNILRCSYNLIFPLLDMLRVAFPHCIPAF